MSSALIYFRQNVNTTCASFLHCWRQGLIDLSSACFVDTSDNAVIWWLKDGAYYFKGIFSRFLNMQEKQILTSAIEIQKRNLQKKKKKKRANLNKPFHIIHSPKSFQKYIVVFTTFLIEN